MNHAKGEPCKTCGKRASLKESVLMRAKAGKSFTSAAFVGLDYPHEQILKALSELQLAGLLVRVKHGRYKAAAK